MPASSGTRTGSRSPFRDPGRRDTPSTPASSGLTRTSSLSGIERTLGPGLTVGLRGNYRRLGSAIETRCDLNADETGSGCAIVTPGSDGTFARGNVPTCNGLIDNDQWSVCGPSGPATPPAKRVYRGIELLARKTLGDRLWIQASYVYSSLRGNYDGGINEGASGRSIPGRNEDFDYPALWHDGYGTLALDRPASLPARRVLGHAVGPLHRAPGVRRIGSAVQPARLLQSQLRLARLPRSPRLGGAPADATGARTSTSRIRSRSGP